MDELLALQQELAAVQSAKSSFKLSEPNIVEVVQKLAELGLLEVLYTTNGKEYVTPKRLLNEVEDEILAHGGRVNITELPPILSVPPTQRTATSLSLVGTGHVGDVGDDTRRLGDLDDEPIDPAGEDFYPSTALRALARILREKSDFHGGIGSHAPPRRGPAWAPLPGGL